jgi:hypothetical protein
MKAVSGAGLPSNPFIYTMILSICERNSAVKSFMHEADLVENYIEVMLEKHCPSNRDEPQYKDLLLLLGYFADEIKKQDSEWIIDTDIAIITRKFNKDIGQKFSFSSCIKPLTRSGVIEECKNEYRFTQACFFNYSYAKFLASQPIDHYEYDKNINYLKFDKVVEYISSIKKCDQSLINYLSSKTFYLWNNLLVMEKIEGINNCHEEMKRIVHHDIIDHAGDMLIDETIVNGSKSIDEHESRLDVVSPLRESPDSVIFKPNDKAPSVLYFESLSLYARSY